MFNRIMMRILYSKIVPQVSVSHPYKILKGQLGGQNPKWIGRKRLKLLMVAPLTLISNRNLYNELMLNNCKHYSSHN